MARERSSESEPDGAGGNGEARWGRYHAGERQAMDSGYFSPQDVYHVISCNRVFHVVALPVEEEYVAWCLEFPNLTAAAATRDEAIEQLTDHIDAVYREQS